MNETCQTAVSLPDTSSDAALLKDARKAALGYARDLRILNTSTEGDFLSLGSSLGSVSSEAQTISTLVASVLDAVKNEEVEKDLERLQDLFNLINNHFRQSRLQLDSGGDALYRMGSIVSAAYEPLAAFRKIVKHLRMLSVSTRIETARLVDGDHGFDVLAKNVESLSVTIGLKAQAFFGGLTALNETIMVAAQRLSASRKAMEEQTELMLETLSANLPKLSEKRSLSLQAVSSLAETSSKVSADVSEVVSSLQFHDITRQQIEHVADVFSEIGADQSAQDGACTTIDTMKHIVGLQIDQLKHAKNQLISAVERVTTNLRRIASLLAKMSTDSTHLMSASGQGGKSFLSELNNSLSLVLGSFVSNEETGESLSVTVTSVTTMVDQLTKFVTDIEDIGSEIELIALNAQIKASHTSEDGGALGVLAEAIRSLSEEAGSQTLILTEALEGVGNTALELDVLGHGEKNAGRKISPVKEQIQIFLEELGRSQQDITCRLGDLDRRSMGLTVSIEKTMRAINTHDMVRKVIDKVNEGLEKVVACGSPAGTIVAGQKDNGYLELVVNRYTMDQERHIYQSYLSGVNGSAGQTKGGDFGDNVELF
jgi:methyl-accepting chemotaxis protein